MLGVAVFSAGSLIASEDLSPVLPSALLAETADEFEPVAGRTQIVYDYVIRNKVDGTLAIQKVNTG